MKLAQWNHWDASIYLSLLQEKANSDPFINSSFDLTFSLKDSDFRSICVSLNTPDKTSKSESTKDDDMEIVSTENASPDNMWMQGLMYLSALNCEKQTGGNKKGIIETINDVVSFFDCIIDYV